MKRKISSCVIVLIVLLLCVFCMPGIGQAALLDMAAYEPPVETSSVSTLASDAEAQRTYLFIHDTSQNMRRKQRIPGMQNAIQSVLDSLPPSTYAGLRAFGHRFPMDGPNACDDTDVVVPIGRLSVNREDFTEQLSLLASTEIGGAAPVGLALQRGLEDLQYVSGPKEVHLYLVDLMKCKEPNPLEVIRSACQMENLHLTLVGFGLNYDLKTLQRNNVEQLGCVDLLNIMTSEEAETLPERLQTRFVVEFRNAEGVLVDPTPGDKLRLRLSRRSEEEEEKPVEVRDKMKDQNVKGVSIDTVGLEQGLYLFDLEYQGQFIRSQHEVMVEAGTETTEVIHLGRLYVNVTDFDGQPLKDTIAQDVEITILDTGQPIRTQSQTKRAQFDLLPGGQYRVYVSYKVGGKLQTTQLQTPVQIQEGNHQQVSVPLPVGALTGQIVNMAGEPVSQVEMLLQNATDEIEEVKRQVTTDEQGRYVIPDVQNGLYELILDKPGFKREIRTVAVVGGKISQVEEIQLFHGIEIDVAAVSGVQLDDVNVTLVQKATSRRIAVTRYQEIYRNAEAVPVGEYRVTVAKTGYQSVTQDVTLQETDAAVEVSFQLPYYIGVQGTILNGKQEPVPETVVEFQNQHSELETEQPLEVGKEGEFQATLLVTGTGKENVLFAWTDLVYNQLYRKEVSFALPPRPETVAVGTIRLPVNFVRLRVLDVLGYGVVADEISLMHEQSGQSGQQLTLLEPGEYESVPLVDGNYTLQIRKKGYQEAETQITVSGGEVVEVPVVLYNYVTVVGTVVNGKNDRVEDALIDFQERNSKVTSPQAILTGRDGRFRTTLLVKQATTEKLTVTWKDADSEREYVLHTEFELPGIPVADFYPMDLGVHQLPVNFLNVEVQDVAGRGISGADVTFISPQGDRIQGIELGGGVYESPDLPDGIYDITVAKPGYKENILLSDISVGEAERMVQSGPIVLPHYIKVTGTVLNGNDETVANTELRFGNQHSEQLQTCRTGADGTFSTTLLVKEIADERWRAVWEQQDYQATGTFSLPLQPGKVVNLGEIRLPINFITFGVEDVQGNPLSDVAVEVSHLDGSALNVPKFRLQEQEDGQYRAYNLPDGSYLFALQKEGYETGHSFELTVRGGEHRILTPVQLGHYLIVTGTAFNGKHEPVPGVAIRFQEEHGTFIRPETAQTQEATEPGQEIEPELSEPVVVTEDDGTFRAELLVTEPGTEQVIVSYGSQEPALYSLNVSGEPGLRKFPLHLPMNFIQIQLEDVVGAPLSEATVTLTHQSERVIFQTQELKPGFYESPSLPNGTYIVSATKENHTTETSVVSVRKGEVQQTAFRLHHYVMVSGHVINGKGEGVAAAAINFSDLKTEVGEKVLSGTDGAFEARLLVKEPGQASAEITWIGANDTYTKSFWVNLPPQPGSLVVPQDETRLPLNFISLEVKGVAATGVPGVTVLFTHQETGRIIEARDLDKGNYEGEELPDGTYTISITKDKYKPLTLEKISVTHGEHKSDIPAPKFPHYISINGTVLNGKEQGVSEAVVTLKSPKRLQEWQPVTTRADGSFTLHALVTDTGSETLEITWNETYTVAVPVTLPPVPDPDPIQLNAIKLPINFIVLTVQDIFGKKLEDVEVVFLKKTQESGQLENLLLEPDFSTVGYASTEFSGRESSSGVYESPELPNGEYIIVASKEGYLQKYYPTVSIKGGTTLSDVNISLPHLVTVEGVVTDGHNLGVADAKITFGGQSSQVSTPQLVTDETGYFSERLQVTNAGDETITVKASGLPGNPGEQFELSQEFELLTKPGTQTFEALRLPINFIPIRVQDISGQAIMDAQVVLTTGSSAQKSETLQQGAGRPLSASLTTPAPVISHEKELYEGAYLKDGAYQIVVAKEGYQTQEKFVTVSGGEVAPESLFELPHYVTVKGLVTDGKASGVSDATLEFDTQHVTVGKWKAGMAGERNFNIPHPANPETVQIKTDADGYFVADLLVKKPGTQHVRVAWNKRYVTQWLFELPARPDMNYVLDEAIRLPINYAPVRVTNVLEEGLAGVENTLQKNGNPDDNPIHLHPLGNGLYEAQELPDGVYSMTLHKEGYRDATGNISVHGGENIEEQHFSLPHFVTVRGTVVNGKGVGVAGARLTLTGLNSQLVEPTQEILTDADGSFQVEVLVTGTEDQNLEEHLEVSWENTAASDEGEPQTIPFGISHDFQLPTTPSEKNLGLLGLPANFASVSVQDITGRGVKEASVEFVDEHGKVFSAREFPGGFYEGQNLPVGTYTVTVSKPGYKQARKTGVQIKPAMRPQQQQSPSSDVLKFELPHYVELQGTIVDGKGQTLGSDVAIELTGLHSSLMPGSVVFGGTGNFEARLLVKTEGQENLSLSYNGSNGRHDRDIPFMLPSVPTTVDLRRVTLPVNFIPIEVRDLRGYGVSNATVTLTHINTRVEIRVTELGNGRYEGRNLLDGTYAIAVSKSDYKAVKDRLVHVEGGMVSEIQSFQLKHYVWITGTAVNGEGDGLRDLMIHVDGLCSRVTDKRSDITGKFEVKLEVQALGNEKMLLTWKNAYRTPRVFKVPGKPERKNLGEIRLPINFVSVLATDISGSTLRDVEVSIRDASGPLQTLKTDQNGFCKTSDLADGMYTLTVKKAGYRTESRDMRVSDGVVLPVRFTLPHYVTVRGTVKDIRQKPVEGAAVIFDDFTGANGQESSSSTTGPEGKFEQQLLIDDPKFLERQKGYFRIQKDRIEQVFTFKIPAASNRVISYKTLLFPRQYFLGKVVDSTMTTVPIQDARVSLIFLAEQLPSSESQTARAASESPQAIQQQEPLQFMTDSLGYFEAGNLQRGEYKLTIQKEGYHTREAYLRISGLLQEQEFMLQKE